jgi:hypothetical protein
LRLIFAFLVFWPGFASDPDRSRLPVRERQFAAADARLRESMEPAEYDGHVEAGTRLSVEEAFALGRAIAESLPG